VSATGQTMGTRALYACLINHIVSPHPTSIKLRSFTRPLEPIMASVVGERHWIDQGDNGIVCLVSESHCELTRLLLCSSQPTIPHKYPNAPSIYQTSSSHQETIVLPLPSSQTKDDIHQPKPETRSLGKPNNNNNNNQQQRQESHPR
jgi:hypothetical protein